MSFFVPSVHVGRSRPFDPDDPFGGRLPFGATRRRPKRKKTPIPWTCNIPYMCQILLVSFTGFIVLLGGVAMSVLGYYPAYFSRETALNGTSVVIVQNNIVYYHIRNFSFIGPILMGIGCFAVMTAGVIYFEFRDKYFRDLPQNEIKTMPKQDVRNLLVDQFRHNYFRGIPIPLIFPSESEKPEKDPEAQGKLTPPIFVKSPKPRKGSSVSVGNSLAPMFSMEFAEIQRAHSTSTLPSLHPAVILSPMNLFQGEKHPNPSTTVDFHGLSVDRGSLVNMFKLAPSSLSRCSSTTGVENPAYLSDDDSTGSLDVQLHGGCRMYGATDDPSGTPSPTDGQFTSVIVHAASIHFPPHSLDLESVSTLQKCKSLTLQHDAHSEGDIANPNVLSEYTNRSCPILDELQGNSKCADWNTGQGSERVRGSKRKTGKNRRKSGARRAHSAVSTLAMCESGIFKPDVNVVLADKTSPSTVEHLCNETCRRNDQVDTHLTIPGKAMQGIDSRVRSIKVKRTKDSREKRSNEQRSDLNAKQGKTSKLVPKQVSNVRRASDVTACSNVNRGTNFTPVFNMRRVSDVTPYSNVRCGIGDTPVSYVRRRSDVTPVSNVRRCSHGTQDNSVMSEWAEVRSDNRVHEASLIPYTNNVPESVTKVRSGRVTPDVNQSLAVSVSPGATRTRRDSHKGSHRDASHSDSSGPGGPNLPGTVSHLGSG